MIFATSDKAAILIKLAEKLPSLRSVVLIDGVASKELSDSASSTKIKLVDLAKLEEEGAAKPSPAAAIGTESIATISFTSGTTGIIQK